MKNENITVSDELFELHTAITSTILLAEEIEENHEMRRLDSSLECDLSGCIGYLYHARARSKGAYLASLPSTEPRVEETEVPTI